VKTESLKYVALGRQMIGHEKADADAFARAAWVASKLSSQQPGLRPIRSTA